MSYMQNQQQRHDTVFCEHMVFVSSNNNLLIKTDGHHKHHFYYKYHAHVTAYSQILFQEIQLLVL